jgi:hypothetical protein
VVKARDRLGESLCKLLSTALPNHVICTPLAFATYILQ